jgi:hypothetical protein
MNGFLDNPATFDQSCVSTVTLAPQLRSSLHAGRIVIASVTAFARVLSESMSLLAIGVPPERYAQVIPLAIAKVREEIGNTS